MSVAKLKRGGFKRIGCWNAVADVAHIRLDGVIPSKPGVYAHVVDGVVCYVGSAQRGLSARMRHYSRTMSMRTAYRIRQEILVALADGATVEVYMLVPDSTPLTYRDLPVDIIAGVEEGLIRSLRPRWNKRGLGLVA